MERPGVDVEDRHRGQLEEPRVPSDLGARVGRTCSRSNASGRALVSTSASRDRRRVGRSSGKDSSSSATGGPTRRAGASTRTAGR